MSRVVLLVDDDPLVLDVAASMLEDIGCEVVRAGPGNLHRRIGGVSA
jgi:CheY-like chemotaxis protein